MYNFGGLYKPTAPWILFPSSNKSSSFCFSPSGDSVGLEVEHFKWYTLDCLVFICILSSGCNNGWMDKYERTTS